MDKYISKFINLSQIYSEPGVSFSGNVLTPEKSREWRFLLDNNLTPEGLMTTKYKDFTIDFVITSSVFINNLDIRGPRVVKRNKFIEYAVWIPYSSVVNDKNPLEKLTQYFKNGISVVLKKLEYSENSIKNIENKIK